MTTRAAMYMRVSTIDRGQSVEMQFLELREYLDRRGWTLAGEYVDKGVSGSKDSRPELDRLMVDARRRRFDALVCYRYDRFSRSLRHLVNSLAEFDALGIHFVSIHEGVDTSTPQGRLVFGIFASIAEFERELIRDRVRSGLRNARAKGKRLGRPVVVADPSRIGVLRGSGLSWRAVAHEMGVSVRSVRRAVLAVAKTPSLGTL
jgi:DNA invertase Pin-like site-specific DNA recombinase